MYQLLTKKDAEQALKFYRNLQLFVNKQNFIGRLKVIPLVRNGLTFNKENGSGSVEIVFSDIKRKNIKNKVFINVQNEKYLSKNKKILTNTILNNKTIKVSFENYKSYNNKKLAILGKFIDQLHPEALLLIPICFGTGIDVGCGYRKTHPDAIGVDWINKGKSGKAGNVKGKRSEADIQTHGDNLHMFKNNSIDYLVARHNLEHYSKPAKTLEEWARVLKKGGLLGVIVPDYKNPNTKEETHYFNFTLNILRKMIEMNGKFKIIRVGDAIPGWSFYCIAKKVN